MGRKKSEPALKVNLTAARAARLYKLLTLLKDGTQTRRKLLTKLKLDLRGFYRDLEALRTLEIEISTSVVNKYSLMGTFDDALERLPFPDPGLNVRDALQLSIGSTSAHRKLRLRVDAFLQGTTPKKASSAKKPRRAS